MANNKIISVISYITIMFITIFAGSYAISSLVQKFATCDVEHINLCTTESICTSNNLYWWDESCHLNKKPKSPICSKEYIHLCTTKNLCEEIKLYWWDESCHTNEKPKPVCSKEYIYLCDTENLCEDIGFYWWDNSCHSNEKPKPEPSEYPDYDSLEDLNSLIIIKDKISWSPEGKIEKIIAYQKQLESVGQFAKIYLYAEVSINDKPLTQYESLYVKLDNEGGHLFRPQSLKIPADTITRLLYAINNVPYLETVPYSENKTPIATNWFQLFKNNSIITLNTFISSLKPATINKIIFYYNCAEDSNCSIKID